MNLKKNLSHRIGSLSKIRHYVPKHLLQTLYYSLFNSDLIYACEIWGRNQTNPLFKRLLLLQGKAIRPINFQPQTSTSNDLFKESRILKISDYVNYRYFVFARKSLRKENLQIFNNTFTPLSINHNNKTCAATNHLVHILETNYSLWNLFYSMTFSSSVTWNMLLRNTNQNFLDCKINEFKRTIIQTYLAKYSNKNQTTAKFIPSTLFTHYYLCYTPSILFLLSILSFLFSFCFLFFSETILPYYLPIYQINYECFLMLICLFVFWIYMLCK